MKIEIISNYSNFKTENNNNTYIVYLFSANWCPPCKASKSFLLTPYDGGKCKLEIFFKSIGNFASKFIENNNSHQLLVNMKEYITQINSKDDIVKKITEFSNSKNMKKEYISYIIEQFTNKYNELYKEGETSLIEKTSLIKKIFDSIIEEEKNNLIGKILNIKLKFVVIDVDQEPDLARKYLIKSIPTFVTVYRNEHLDEHITTDPGSVVNDKQIEERFIPILGKVLNNFIKNN